MNADQKTRLMREVRFVMLKTLPGSTAVQAVENCATLIDSAIDNVSREIQPLGEDEHSSMHLCDHPSTKRVGDAAVWCRNCGAVAISAMEGVTWSTPNGVKLVKVPE